MMDPIAAKQGTAPEGYAFRDLLEFCPDGAGNAQCFHRRDEEDDDPRAVDWDHETWEISDETWFADFADRRLGECVADEE